MEVNIMIEFIIILLIVASILWPIAIFVCYNASNSERWINKTIDEVPGFCPYKYKWQIADDLSMRNKQSKFSYLMTMPKSRVKELWVREVHDLYPII
jgi:hypothetical protein